MSKKEKTINLGSIIKGKYGPFLSLDKSIKSVTIEREYQSKGDTIRETVKVGQNDKGYLNPANIQKIKDAVNFKLEKEWITEEQADKIIENSEKYNISSEVTVKVSN